MQIATPNGLLSLLSFKLRTKFITRGNVCCPLMLQNPI